MSASEWIREDKNADLADNVTQNTYSFHVREKEKEPANAAKGEYCDNCENASMCKNNGAHI